MVLGFDFQPPGQGGWFAEQFLVEVVSPASDGLCQQDAGGDGVCHRQHAQPVTAAAEPDAQRSPADGAPDRDAAFPDGEDFPRVATAVIARAEVFVGYRNDVIQSRADNSEDHGPQTNVVDVFWFAAACRPAFAAQPEREDTAGNDAQRVDVDLDWAEFDPVGGWWRDRRDQVCKVHDG